MWFLFDKPNKLSRCTSDTNKQTNSEKLHTIRWTQPTTRKKFHLPHGASQGKRGTKGDRVK